MYRFLARPKWILFTLVVVAAIVAMVNLSLWQVRRLHERQAFNSLVAARLQSPPVPVGDPRHLGLDDEWATVIATGEYHGDPQLEPSVGTYRVISPFTLAGGGTLLVERGSMLTTASAAPPPPTGTVQLIGRVRRAPSTFGILAPSDDRRTMIVQVIQSAPPDAASLTPAPLPDLTDEGPHLSYAVQWAIFSVCVAIGWVLAVRRSARTHATPADAGNAAEAGNEADAARAAKAKAKAAKRSKHQAVPWRDAP